MKISFALLCLLAILEGYPFASCDPSVNTEFRCGETTVYSNVNRRVRRVVGGGPALKGAWPWVAIIANRRSNIVETLNTGLSGGGSLINNRWILTTATVASGLLARYKDKNITEKVIIGLGYNHLPDIDAYQNRDGRLFKPGKILIHPKFDLTSNLLFDYDVALISIGTEVILNGDLLVDLDENSGGSVVFTQYIRPVCLPCTGTCVTPEDLILEDGTNLLTGNETDEEACAIEGVWLTGRWDPHNNVEAVVMGFGVTTNISDLTTAKTLQQGLLKMQNQIECEKFWTRVGFQTIQYPSQRTICARSSSDDIVTDACIGDSGNGLVREIFNVKGRRCWVEVGIVSSGIGCGIRVDNYTYPGFYTDVSSVFPWIKDIMQN